MFGAAVWLVGAVRGRPRATALLVGPAAWAVALAAVPLHPMNFCANGGREDISFVYLPLALAAGPAALAVSLTPLARPSILTHTFVVAALLLVASTPLFVQGYDGPWLVSQAWRSAGALAVLGLLAQLVARTAAWAWSDPSRLR
jgi:hypothetical protein